MISRTLSTSPASFSLFLTVLLKLSGRSHCAWEAREKDLFAIHVSDLLLALQGGNVSQIEFSSKVTHLLANFA